MVALATIVAGRPFATLALLPLMQGLLGYPVVLSGLLLVPRDILVCGIVQGMGLIWVPLTTLATAQAGERGQISLFFTYMEPPCESK